MFAQLLTPDLYCQAAFVPRRTPIFPEKEDENEEQVKVEPKMQGFKLDHYAIIGLVTEYD